MKSFLKITSVVIVLLALSCNKSKVPAEFQLKTPICNGARSYRNIQWLDRYISELKKDRINVGATIHHVKYKGKGYFEVMVPISSRFPYAHFDCDGKVPTFSNDQEAQDYIINQTDRVLVWQFK